jgi:hypothetical protein
MKQEYHSNATTNLHMRLDINKSNLTNLMLANKFGISEPTVSKWKNRAIFEDKSSRPHTIHYALNDFEKTLIFNDANVHTTLVFAKKNTQNHLMQFYTYTVNNPLLMVDLSFGYAFCELERSNQSEKWLIADNQNQKIIDKLHSDSKFIGEICDIAKGSESGKNEVFTITLEDVKNYNIENSVLRKCVKNSDVLRYYLNEKDSYLIYADNNFSKILFPNAFKYLELHKDILLDRRGPKTNEYEWWRLHRPSIKEIFDSNEKLLVPYRATRNRFAYDNQQFFNNGGDIRCMVVKENIEISLKYILVLLNSKLLIS